MTAPFMIESSHPLYNVNDVFKWHLCQWQCAWQCYVFGAGAGKLPTASAVVSDVVDCVKHKGTNVMTVWSNKELQLGNTQDQVRSFCKSKGKFD